MISFECDYNNGACQEVLDNLIKYNNAKPTPYGFDEFSERAKARIREACGMPLPDRRHPDQCHDHRLDALSVRGRHLRGVRPHQCPRGWSRGVHGA